MTIWIAIQSKLPGAQDRQTLTNEQFRINSFPSMAIDRSTGGFAIVWARRPRGRKLRYRRHHVPRA